MTFRERETSSMLVILVLCATLIFTGALAMGRFLWLMPLPCLEGEVTVNGLREPVTIKRDSFGVPKIEATSLEDAVFGQGFVHAQDRLWQMELNRRVGHGRLAEVLGPKAVGADCFLRRLGLGQAALSDLHALTESESALLEAYCAGVNEGIASLGWRLPIEYWLLWCKPEPWTPLDSLVWIQVMSMDLAANWEQELLRCQLISHLEPEQAAALHLHHGEATTVLSLENLKVDFDELVDLYRQAKEFLPNGGSPGASNAWVVSGQRSGSGFPLLASDPHLVGRVPGIWYEVQLEAPGLCVAGVSFPGLPLVVIGRNSDLAWGITNAYADTEDLFVERFENDDSDRYQTEDGWQEAQVRLETFVIRGGGEVQEKMLATRHGPVLFRGQEYSLALSSVNFEPSHPVATILALNTARNAQEFREALAGWQAPASNFVFADRHQNIGFVLAGSIPKRKQGTGLTPVPGWSGEFEWEGKIAFEDLPQCLNPAKGYLVSANNPVAGLDYSQFLTWDWMSAARAERLEQLLQSKEVHQFQDFALYQADLQCQVGLSFAKFCASASIPIRDEQGKRALEILTEWDGHGGPESVGMAIYQVLSLAVARELLVPVIGEELTNDLLGDTNSPVSLMASHTGRTTVWLLQLLTDRQRLGALIAPEKLPPLLGRALMKSVSELEQLLGQDMETWRWGRLHGLSFEHALGNFPLLGSRLNGPWVEMGGDTDTVCQTAVNPMDPYGARAWCPSWRQVVDLRDPMAAQSVLPTGQSGHPASPNYLDQFELWVKGLLRGPDDPEQARKLVLRPGGLGGSASGFGTLSNGTNGTAGTP